MSQKGTPRDLSKFLEQMERRWSGRGGAVGDPELLYVYRPFCMINTPRKELEKLRGDSLKQ